MASKSPVLAKKVRCRKTDPLNEVIECVKKDQLHNFKNLVEDERLLEMFKKRLAERRVPAEHSPLVVAVLNNASGVFKHILDAFQPEVNLEQETSAVIEGGYPVEGATPLWTSSTLGRLDFVRLLVDGGAQIEHTTDSRSTPLRGAAFDGHCDVCAYLIDHGADIDKPNQVGQSPLTIAAAMKKTECVKLLIRKGANVNHRGHNGDTPLHVCVESGAVDIAKILVEAGARNDPNDVGFTPSILACCYGHDKVMEFLDSTFRLEPRERYDCYCLLAAKEVLGNDDSSADQWMIKAVKIRTEHPKEFENIPRPTEVYDYLQEPANEREVNYIMQDETRMFFVSSIYCERILGRIHPTTAFYIRISGDMALAEERYSKCIQLWQRSLDFDHAARMAYELQITEDLMFSIRGFSIMAEKNYSPPVEPHFHWGVKEFRLAHESKISEIDVICCLSRMLAAWIKVASKFTDEANRAKENEKINAATRELITATESLTTPLLIACLQNLPENASGASRDICVSKLPLHSVLAKLLDLGCFVQCEDTSGNFPLHLAVQLKEDSALECVRTLLEYGCHIDAVNYNGETALEVAEKGCGYEKLGVEIVGELKRCGFQNTTLQCLTSRAILANTIEFASVLPRNVVQFVSWHEADPNQDQPMAEPRSGGQPLQNGLGAVGGDEAS